MDGASAGGRYLTIGVISECRCVGGRGDCDEALGVNAGGTGVSADLGGSSKYSIENFEDRSGEGFHGNSTWTWVSRS